MNEVEEISRVFDGNSVIVVLRSINVESGSQSMPVCENGMTLSEMYDAICQNSIEEELVSLPTKKQIEINVECVRNMSHLISGVLNNIKPTTLSSLFMNITNSMDYYEDFLETQYCPQIYEYMQILNNLKQKLLHFYHNNPFRTLELSNDLSQEILTPEICLTKPFLPYITRKLETPRWMVPRTVRTLNEASRIYQTREFIEKEGMELFMVLACYERIPLNLWKMVAHFAVDMTKLRFNLFKVVTEKMLKGSEYVKVSHLDLTTRIPNVIYIV